jgi:hypothetical protein
MHHNTHTLIPFTRHVHNGQIHSEKERSGEWLLNWRGVSFGGNENALELDHGDGCTTLWVCEKLVKFYFKMVCFMICELQPKKKKNKSQLKEHLLPGMVASACSSRTQEAEAGGSSVQGQPGQKVSKTSSQQTSQVCWPIFLILAT